MGAGWKRAETFRRRSGDRAVSQFLPLEEMGMPCPSRQARWPLLGPAPLQGHSQPLIAGSRAVREAALLPGLTKACSRVEGVSPQLPAKPGA